ncbi:MAG: ATP-grasp domain-containing protein [Pseudomonadota bacterium]|nr:MAG: ATP-grasp domain-containing protein [Pseudomonadota bacterium]
MFKTVLIANRGEIACRIIATCRRLGVETVAVYSDADASARHVRLADRAVHVGAAPARESYLDIDRIIEAARATGAEAIHPGYGFLAENAGFARAVRNAGLILIGPAPETMELMGSKAAAKARMETANVPLIPGYHGDDQADDALMKEAGRVGFPLMLKAAAGGGGKGMRVVRSKEDFLEALKSARREASGAFGDERMILERYLERPRHIEAQIFADGHGTTVHLFERDCSSQRRHQKIIEEAPAPNLDQRIRQDLLAAAVRAAKAVDYVGAGTVEFMVEDEAFYFLEMNTRLQVEHPVTELTTGLDLVEWQLRIAAGEALPLRQDEIRASGHAMEARIYAEDPDQGFVPSTGRIDALVLPESDRVRIDSGVISGDQVSMHYDPMIAKLVVHDSTREACLARLNQALATCFVAGPATNLGFLQALAGSGVFTEAAIDTGMLDRDLAAILDAGKPPLEVLAAAAGRWLLMQEAAAGGLTPWDIRDSWRLGEPVRRSLDIECAGSRVILEASGCLGDYDLQINDETHPMRMQRLSESEFSLTLGGRGRRLQIHAAGEHRLEVCLDRRRWPVVRHARFEAVVEGGAGDGRLLAPMPGKILEIRATTGQSVAEGETLLIMEAMKMELAIKAPVDGTITELAVGLDEIVEADAMLLVVEPS